jgi:hypothetical protein
MRVGGAQHEAQSLKVRMSEDALDEPGAEPSAAMSLDDEHVGQPGEPGAICHQPRESCLPGG